ncbi:hypothetical protein CK203_108981 [Vitis vinifera]|uniref:Uncharacterized protein n=1 Tax=Vitis vinifera TaxID=29760 RepID=A0A438D433_VITVI|nr:hypothetical protein CK203_108981 [Vitis vinifera]
MKCPGDDEATTSGVDNEDHDDEHEDEFENEVVLRQHGAWICGGFWGVFGPLIINRSWRRAYFRFLDEMKDRVMVVITRLQKKCKWEKKTTWNLNRYPSTSFKPKINCLCVSVICFMLNPDHIWTPPSENTWHASYSDTWHALSSESPSADLPIKHTRHAFSGLPQGRSNDTYKHIIRTTYTIHSDDQGRSNDTYKHIIRTTYTIHPDDQGRSNDTYKHIIRMDYTIHPDDQHMPSGGNAPDH